MPTLCYKPHGLHTTHCDTNTPNLPATPLLRIRVLRDGGGKDHAKECSVAFSRMRLLGFIRHVCVWYPRPHEEQPATRGMDELSMDDHRAATFRTNSKLIWPGSNRL
jgi:hypothetical protein